MGQPKSKSQPSTIVDIAIRGLQNLKGEDIICIDLKNLENVVCDFFLICTGTSNTHVSALANSVESEVKKELNDKPWHTEGFGNAEWILLDYVDTVVHIFQKESREFYNLENLWADGVIAKIKEA